MAILHTDLPTKHGELLLARRLQSIDDSALHLWCALDHIPSVPDIDLLVLHEHAGIFVIEVKAINLRMIRSYSLSKCEIEDRPDTRTPHLQASIAMFSLKQLLDRNTGQLAPWMVATACFPNITRREWKDYFGKETEISGDYSESIIFSCDIDGDDRTFKDRLQHIWYNPPARKGARKPFSYKPLLIDQINGAVVPISQKPVAAPSDYDRLRIIEREIKKEALQRCPLDQQNHIFYTGRPGTGKTFRLIAIGMAQATAGRNVLFICFNKTLAADISRLILLSEQLRKRLMSEEAVFDVFDIFQFAKRFMDGEYNSDHGKWFHLALQHAKLAKEQSGLPTYDLILVDEAQDMTEEYLQLVSLHYSTLTSLCVAAGSGQELYGTASEWLEDFQTDPKTDFIRLRRNFRNTLPIYQIAQVFYESALNIELAKEFTKKFKRSQQKQLEMEFERLHGEWPIVPNIDDSKLHWEDPSTLAFQADLDKVMINRYDEIINDQVEALTARERPIDILVLVPSFTSPERQWAYAALTIVTKRHSINFLETTLKTTTDASQGILTSSGSVRMHQPEDLKVIEQLFLVLKVLNDYARKRNRL